MKPVDVTTHTCNLLEAVAALTQKDLNAAVADMTWDERDSLRVALDAAGEEE